MDTTQSDSGPEPTFMGVPREKIPWWPRIDQDKCDGCAGEYDCFKFCPHRVYRKRTDPPKIEVENRYNCVVFCQACRKMCPRDAISFPDKAEILQVIKAARTASGV
ncbi:MAG: ferredoxin family protein [Candidatus Thorarchaeota archaeon]|nr:ferredoxin family protein [Candidatus Thorarchaeota archaeon]